MVALPRRFRGCGVGVGRRRRPLPAPRDFSGSFATSSQARTSGSLTCRATQDDLESTSSRSRSPQRCATTPLGNDYSFASYIWDLCNLRVTDYYRKIRTSPTSPSYSTPTRSSRACARRRRARRSGRLYVESAGARHGGRGIAEGTPRQAAAQKAGVTQREMDAMLETLRDELAAHGVV